ncbi:MAG: MBL fold metallo-hydrolase [Syntrophothermus sp.]
MKLTFWGVRGSIPAPLGELELREIMHKLLGKCTPKDDLATFEGREEVINRYTSHEPAVIGGNTTCLELQADDKMLIFDMGTGIRKLGNKILSNGGEISEFHIFLSHTHWDHIQGFPFFLPAYLPKYKLNFYSVHNQLKERLELQQDFRFFPVAMEQMASEKEFIQLKEGCEITLGELIIKNKLLFHPGKSFGYSVVHKNKKFVFATDSEYKSTDKPYINKYIEFFRNADLVVFDSQYSLSEALHKENWGHSSAIMGIDIAVQAGVKKLALTHHEPENETDKLIRMHKQAIQYKNVNYPDIELEIMLAREGITLEI